MRYFLRLAFNGTPFHGWQIQPNAVSVQEVLEDALSTVLRDKISVVGAGRTDTGVNARVMYAHFDVPEPIADRRRFLLSLSRLCGRDIAVADVLRVADDAHARFDATEREYRYFVAFEKSPFLPFCWFSPSRLDVEAMNAAAALLRDTEDFTSFAKLHSDARTNICDVRKAGWSEWKNDYGVPGIVFKIRADRFLRNMVRAVVGTLVDVGRGHISMDGFGEIVCARDRCAAGTSMPPQALFLWDISYPGSVFDSVP